MTVPIQSPDRHELKCHPDFFESVLKNEKPFELRKDDRGFKVGDTLYLREYDPGTKMANNARLDPDVGYYSGRNCFRRITYILRDFDGLLPEYVILGLGSV